jgi:HSP20 family protein
MKFRKSTALAPVRDPFTLLRQMTSELDRVFEEPEWPAFRWPSLRTPPAVETASWLPAIDVFEREGRLVTKIDLPGMKKENVKVELADNHVVISGERKTEAEEKRDTFYRCEREYGSFYRAVPLPEGVPFEDVKATFADGVLEVSIPIPAKVGPKIQKVEIEEPQKPVKTAA